MNMNYGSMGPGAMVRCRQCSSSITAMPGARAVQCMQCSCVTRVSGRGRQQHGYGQGYGGNGGGMLMPPMRPTPAFGGGRGKKRAVLIGIKYTNRRSCELRGPINDVKCMRYLLTERFGFPNDCVLILTRRGTRAGSRPRTTSAWRCTGWCRGAATATPWCSSSLAWARRCPTTTATSWTAWTRPSAPWTRSSRAPSWTTRSTRPSSARWCTASSSTPSSTPATAPPSSTSPTNAPCPSSRALEVEGRAPYDRRLQGHQRRPGRAHQRQQQRKEQHERGCLSPTPRSAP
ncbi:unnamed protein product [Triticum turgidum subsp. durum]|uniref:Peptidase C14 caspase domain-containing protein n=1 Tax=Triticum turgidum subsp. durum TaxID=4567 RepID=A0A9R0RXP7_TRITD|nr:unnamed protein product [Triticum turgidum subsp. durum]